ncbi:MAG: hypothetical protein ACREP7_23875 [Lysobacter sp.]
MKNIIATAILLLNAVPCFAQTPPSTWQEHWFEHNQNLSRVYYDNDLAVYYDADVSRSVTWPSTYLGDVWRYTKRVYGDFGGENRLYAIFHTNKYSGGHPSTYFDASHDLRNVIDAGPGPWTSGAGNDLDLTTHEVAHIVELASKNVHGSPAFGIWGDSKWAEIFNYDVYLGLGRTADATRWYNIAVNTHDNFPVADTYWFRDWFYPIYNQYGRSAVLNRYFELLAQYFPKNGNDYSRDLNMGEFIHFWSGAAGVDLKPQATLAFGWTSQYESQLVAARNAFPFGYSRGVATFYQDCSNGGYFSGLAVGDYRLSEMRKKGLQNDDISSITINSGYQVQLFEHDNFTGASITLTGSQGSCLTSNGWNDRVSSLRIRAL